MKRYFLSWILFSINYSSIAQSYLRLHKKSIVVDTHNDVLSTATMCGLDIGGNLSGKTHSDLERFRRGGVDVQIFSIFCDERYGNGIALRYANTEIDSLFDIAARNRDKMTIVAAPTKLQKAVREKKLAAIMGVEGGHMIEENLDNLDSFYRRGVRYLTLTWNNSTSWSTSAKDESSAVAGPMSENPDSFRKPGLNDFGKRVIKRMNELGMIVDLSHVGEQTFYDALQTTSKPVIASHSCAYSLCPHFRNLKDDQIRAIGKNDGVIFVNFYSGFLDSNYAKRLEAFQALRQKEMDSLQNLKWPKYEVDEWLAKKYHAESDQLRPPLSLLIDHIEYIIKLIGVDHVGLGSDFDGIESTPRGLDDVSCFPLITNELRKKGYSRRSVRKILGGNFLRVFRANVDLH